jgi:hypothetical protein
MKSLLRIVSGILSSSAQGSSATGVSVACFSVMSLTFFMKTNDATMRPAATAMIRLVNTVSTRTNSIRKASDRGTLRRWLMPQVVDDVNPDGNEQTCKDGAGNMPDQARQAEQHSGEKQAMDHTRQAVSPASLDVDDGAHGGARAGNAADQTSGNVSQALPDEFAIAVNVANRHRPQRSDAAVPSHGAIGAWGALLPLRQIVSRSGMFHQKLQFD